MLQQHWDKYGMADPEAVDRRIDATENQTATRLTTKRDKGELLAAIRTLEDAIIASKLSEAQINAILTNLRKQNII